MLADTLVARAIECEGLCYSDAEKRRAFLLHQYPGDVDANGEPNANAHNMGRGQYGCLMHARGVLAEHDEIDGNVGGVDLLRCAYAPRLGQIGPMLRRFGEARGVLSIRPEDFGDIRPGDIVVHGFGGMAPGDPGERARWSAEWGGVTHGAFVVGVDGDRIECIDGGQPDVAPGGPGSAIRRIVRPLAKRANGWWLGSKRIAWRIRAGGL